MATRDFTKVNSALWSDDDWRALSRDQQWLYFLLWTHPELNAAGVCDWRPQRLTAFSSGTSAEEVRALALSLQGKRFILFDDATEEVLVRPYIRHDERFKIPNSAKSVCNAHSSTGSQKIREVIVYESRKVHRQSPNLSGFTSESSRKEVSDLLKQSANPIDKFIQPNAGGSNNSSISSSLNTSDSCSDNSKTNGSDSGSVKGPADVRQRHKTVTPGSSEGSKGGSQAGSSEDLTEASSDDFFLLSEEESGPSIEDQFEEFWSHWPRKVKKPKALEAFVKAVKDKRATAETVIAAAESYAASELPEKKFIPHPATWLNADQWNDLDANDRQPGNPDRPSLSNPGSFTNWSSDDYRPWEDRPQVIEAQERVDKAREEGEEPTDDDLRIIAGPPGG